MAPAHRGGAVSTTAGDRQLLWSRIPCRAGYRARPLGAAARSSHTIAGALVIARRSTATGETAKRCGIAKQLNSSTGPTARAPS